MYFLWHEHSPRIPSLTRTSFDIPRAIWFALSQPRKYVTSTAYHLTSHRPTAGSAGRAAHGPRLAASLNVWKLRVGFFQPLEKCGAFMKTNITLALLLAVTAILPDLSRAAESLNPKAAGIQVTPFFMTHHAPMGAWSSFTFGQPGMGVGIDHELLKVDTTGDLLVAISRGTNDVRVMPFINGLKTEDYEGKVAGGAQPTAYRHWKISSPQQLQRQLTPSVDEFTGGDLRLRVYSPRFDLPDPNTGVAMKDAICPAVLVEVEVDNTHSDKPANGFFGLAYQGAGKIRPLDWSSDGQLCGIAFGGKWAIAAKAKPHEVFTVRSYSIASHVESGQPIIHPSGSEGGILFTVPAGKRSTLVCAIGFHHAGDATQGIACRYAYTDDFADVESVCRHALDNAERIKAAATTFDRNAASGGAAERCNQLLAQASQAYYANSSLLRDAGGRYYWSVCEGQFAWRNTLDLAADHLPFELWRHPWISRNVIDLFFDRYSYHDQVRFPDHPDEKHPGGLSFTHDQGNYTTYSPAGSSAYELPGRDGVYSFMTTEQLLNGIYCAAAYAIATGDRQWAEHRVKEAEELLSSLENRDHYDPAQREGLLKGETDHVATGAEITTYDALDHSLKNSRGNIYVAVKTWCAALMLGDLLELGGDKKRAEAARAFAKKTAASVLKKFDQDRQRFPANLYTGGSSHVMAAKQVAQRLQARRQHRGRDVVRRREHHHSLELSSRGADHVRLHHHLRPVGDVLDMPEPTGVEHSEAVAAKVLASAAAIH